MTRFDRDRVDGREILNEVSNHRRQAARTATTARQLQRRKFAHQRRMEELHRIAARFDIEPVGDDPTIALAA